MDNRPPAPADDVAAAGWIAGRLVNDSGAVGCTIPTGYEAYARILHPADLWSAKPRRWAEVAASNGRTMHAQAQFVRISTPAPGHDRTLDDIQPPNAGDLAHRQLAASCEVLHRHTPQPMACWFAEWEGWAELTGSVFAVSAYWAERPPTPQPAPKDWQLDLRAAQFDLPRRRYYLFTGSIDDALRIGYWSTRDWFDPRSPNLFWPDDHRWCVATEIDFDSTLIAGTADLIDDILHNDDLEAWPVSPHDSLAWDADTINQP